MPETVIASLAIIGCLQSLQSWRRGVYCMIIIAILVDPLRKLVPGAPGYLMLANLPVLTAILVMTITKPHVKLGAIVPNLGILVAIFAIACIPPAFISGFYGAGSWKLTVFGAIAYSILIFSIFVGYNFARKISDIRYLFGTYCALSSILLSGALIEFFDVWPDSPLIGTEVLGWDWIRSVSGYHMEMISGFYRSPDVMGWHAATVTMLALLLALTKHGNGRWVWLALGVIGIVALLLCGRRKMVYMLPLFVTFASLIYVLSGGKRALTTLAPFVFVPLVALSVIGGWIASESNFVRYYTETQEQAADQVEAQGFATVVSTYRQTGFFGGGLGAATPGSHHLNVERPRAWQESGTSRIMFELGVPGVLALLALVFAILRSSWRVICYQQRTNPNHALYPIGITAIFLANMASFGVSGQILADPFVAFFVSFLIGVAVSFGRAPFQSGARPRARRMPHCRYADNFAIRARV